MFDRLKLVILLLTSTALFAIGFSVQTRAQSNEMRQAFSQYQKSDGEGDAVATLQHIMRFLEFAESEFGRSHSHYAAGLQFLANVYEKNGLMGDAILAYRHSLKISLKNNKSENEIVAASQINLGAALKRSGLYFEAEEHYSRALVTFQKIHGPRSKEVAGAKNILALLMMDLGRYKNAATLSLASLQIYEEMFPPDHSIIATGQNNLGLALLKLGSFSEAREMFQRSLRSTKSLRGKVHPDLAISLNNLGLLFQELGNFIDAERLFQRSHAILSKFFGSDNPSIATALNNLGGLRMAKGQYIDAESAYRRSLLILQSSQGLEHPDTANVLTNIALLYTRQGRFAKAESFYKNSLGIKEKLLGPSHPSVSITLNNLAELYVVQGRYHEAESLHWRSLEIGRQALGPMHSAVGRSLNNLASLFNIQRRHKEALELHLRSLKIRKMALGPDHPDVALSLNNIAMVYSYQGRYEKALELHLRSIKIREKALGPDHPDLASSLNNIAFVHSRLDRNNEALELFQRSLAIRKKVLGLNHPDVAAGFSNIAFVLSDQGLYEGALEHLRRATAIERRRFVGLGSKESKGLLSEQRDARWGFYKHVDLALHPEQTGVRAGLDREAFEVLQLAGTSSAGSALAQMAVRFASGSDAVSDLVRQRQDAEHQFEALDGNLVKAISAATNKRNDILIGNLRRQLGDTKTQIEALDREIEEKFPEYAALTSREPLSVRDVQKLLGQDEALLTFTRSWERDKTHVFVVRQKGLTVYTVDVGLDELRKSVDTLRSSLDLSVVGSLGSLPPFDTTVAFELYDKLLGPAAPALEGVKHLFVVPTGPLQSLPLGVLVTRRPATSGPDVPANDNGNRLQTRGLVTVPGKEVPVVEADNRVLAARYGHYRDVPWLAKRYALTTLPTVASLKSLRTFAKRSKASKPFAGFGDPVLDGNAGRNKGVEITAMFRGALANVDEVRKLSRLPDTADELRSMAQYLGADDGSVFLGSRATEAQVKQMNLSDRRVVAFSTHGLISGELKYLAEPALVLTPPDKATDQDDGLLAASEIAQLKLDADWVILSACNTAHADKPGAQGLTGLAKAFFYAGSRALLVSHWPVESRSATALTEDLFREFEQNPDIGRAEALRRSMLNVAANDNHPQWAHPAYWAPFVVVGEGLRR